MTDKVILYTAPNCSTSDQARADLLADGVEFEERRVDENEQWWEEALKYAFTVPVIIWAEANVEIGWEGEHG